MLDLCDAKLKEVSLFQFFIFCHIISFHVINRVCVCRRRTGW